MWLLIRWYINAMCIWCYKVLTAVVVSSTSECDPGEWLYISLCDDYWCGYLLDGTSTLHASGATKYSLQSAYRLQVRVIRVNDYISLRDDYWCGYLLDGTSTLRASGATRYSLQSSYRLQVRVILANNIYALDVIRITVAAFWMVIYRILHIRSYTTLFRFLWCLLVHHNHLQVIIYKLLGEHNWLMIVGNFSLIPLYDDNPVAIMCKCVNNNTL